MFVLPLVLFVTLCLPFMCLGSVKDLHVALLGSKGTINVETSQALIGANLAVDVINNATILPGYRLVTLEKLSRCVAEDALQDFFEVLQTFLNNQTSSHPMFIIGAGCSVRSRPIAHSVSYWNMIQVAYSSSSPVLSDRVAYPNFFRLLANSTARYLAELQYVEYLGYQNQRVGLIVQDVGLFTGFLQTLLKEASEKEINLEVARFSADSFIEVKTLFKHPPKLFIINAYQGFARKVFCMAHERGLYMDEYAWIVPGWYGNEWWKDMTYEDDCSSENVTRVVNRAISINVVPRTHNTTDVLRTHQQVTDHYDKETAHDPRPFNEVYSRYAYDAVWLMALALNKSIPKLQEHGLSLEDYHLFSENGSRIADTVKDIIQGLNFVGVSGNVSFYNGTGNRIVSGATLSQIRTTGESEELESVLFADFVDGELEYRPGQSNTTVFPDGPPMPPMEETLVPELWVYALFITLAFLAILLSFFFVLFTIWYRKERVIKASSPALNIIVACGTVISYIWIALSNPPVPNLEVYKVTCPAFLWLNSLAITLILGPLTLKSWRIYYIFHNPKPKKVVKTWVLLLILLALIVLDFTVLTILTGVPHTKLVPTKLKRDDGVFYFSCGACADKIDNFTREDLKYTIVVAFMVFGYKIVLALLGLFYAFQTRNIKLKILRESRQTSAAIFAFIGAALLSGVLTPFLSKYPDIQFVLNSIVLIAGGVLTNIFIFIPKVYYLWFTKCRKGAGEVESTSTMWTDSEEMSSLHQATLAGMQQQIGSLKQQVANCNCKDLSEDSSAVPTSSDVPYKAYEKSSLKHRPRSVTWSVNSICLPDGEALLDSSKGTGEETSQNSIS